MLLRTTLVVAVGWRGVLGLVGWARRGVRVCGPCMRVASVWSGVVARSVLSCGVERYRVEMKREERGKVDGQVDGQVGGSEASEVKVVGRSGGSVEVGQWVGGVVGWWGGVPCSKWRCVRWWVPAGEWGVRVRVVVVGAYGCVWVCG